MSNELIHFDSPEAAQLVTVTGWRSRNGHIYGPGDSAEQSARYDGCTHRACERCGKPARKSYLICDECRELAAVEKYNARPRAEWNGSDMLYSEGADRWFNDIDELRDYCEDNDATPESLRLVISEPVLAKPIDPNEHYCAGFRGLIERVLPATDCAPLLKVERRLAAGVLMSVEDIDAALELLKPIEKPLMGLSVEAVTSGVRTEQIQIEIDSLGVAA